MEISKEEAEEKLPKTYPEKAAALRLRGMPQFMNPSRTEHQNVAQLTSFAWPAGTAAHAPEQEEKMSYRLTGITLETNVTPESMETLNEVWKDIVSGKLPLMYDTDGNFIEGLSPITEFRNMTFEESQEYPIHIRTVNPNFFAILEAQTAAGMYKKYEGEDDSDIDAAADEVWDAIEADAKAGILDGTNLSGFESTVPPEYTPDHKAHSIVYIRTDK